MQQVTKVRATELAAAAVRAACQAGQWSGRLPGVRVLARQLGVSVPTVAAALSRLVEEGVLTGGGARRAYRVGVTGAKQRPQTRRPRLVILTPTGPERLDTFARELFERIRETMIAKGWETEARALDYRRAGRPHCGWDRQVRVDGETSVVAALGNPALAEWVARQGGRALFLGGVRPVQPVQPVTMIAVRSSDMAEAAFARLTALGHHRIIFPLCGHPEAYNEAMRRTTRTALEAAGHAYQQSLHNPESAYLEADVVWRMLENHFATLPPTALVVSDWQIMVTVSCYLGRAGLRVPEDVSLVLLSDHEEAAWFRPALARFRFPMGRMTAAVRHWLEDPAAPPRHRIFSPEFITAETLASPVEQAADAVETRPRV